MAGKPRMISPEMDASNQIYQVAREQADIEITELKSQQARIAEAHEIAGRIQAFTFVEKVVSITSLMQLKNVKDSKVYRELPNIGTWESYCNYIGLDRHTTDERLRQLETLGSQFLETCHQFSVSHKDMRKLRQLTHDGTLVIDAEAVEIGGERIPLDSDHREDLQAAIETIIEEQAKAKAEISAQQKAFDRVQTATHKEVQKLQQQVDKLEGKAAAKGMTGEEDAYLNNVFTLRVGFDGYMLKMESAFEELANRDHTPREAAALISTLDYMRMTASAWQDRAVIDIGGPQLNPQVMEEFEAWGRENMPPKI
jgi:hypothetical protein